ncbi:unnamed protein product [Bursaphelenchus okinawaensis]|uniref:Uncharacterized protein n=1 Tax=Bursaphelenchus okinawaensis TaxID=465554 RepID=A0A811LT17_9BILA|nr:unnamed protein product [Bursaphelenchus okinawaensis]CAG9127604.1 unnamed protein product [Bursaphelenchus okinawaensis]
MQGQKYQKPNTYQKQPLVRNDQDGFIFPGNDECGIKKESTFRSYDHLVHAIIKYEMKARVHLLRNSSNFLKANKKVAFPEETCRQFVFDRIVFKCPNHEVTKRFDSQTGEALYNKRVTKRNIEDPRKCEFTFTVQYNPEINRLQISAGKLYHTGRCNPSVNGLFEYVPKDENNKKKRAIHNKIEELQPTQLPVLYNYKEKTEAFRSKNRTLWMPNANVPISQDSDVRTEPYCDEVEALISRYVNDCIKKPVGETSEAGPSTSRGTKRRMANEDGVAAKRANDGRGLRPGMNSEDAELGEAVSYAFQPDPVMFEGHVLPTQQVVQDRAQTYGQHQAYCQPAYLSQNYWHQPVGGYEHYYSPSATELYYDQSEASGNGYDQSGADMNIFEPNFCQYRTFGQKACQPPQCYSQTIENPVATGPIAQPGFFIRPEDDMFAEFSDEYIARMASGLFDENDQENNLAEPLIEQPLHVIYQKAQALPPVQEVEAAVQPIQQPIIENEQESAPAPEEARQTETTEEENEGEEDILAAAMRFI